MARKNKQADTAPTKPQKVNEAWSELFIQNEKVAKAKKLTDDELVEEMQERFPDKAQKTTITRCSMARSCYNKGTNMFARMGEAGTTERPLSHKYDEDGNVVPGRGSKKAEASETKPKTHAKKAKEEEAPAKPARRRKAKAEDAAASEEKPIRRRRRTAAK